ncbi:PGC-1 and ERR-induced regulator in muscle protein 1 [Perognathus longimembris pacificus]|uniref:PGC-1 and ERR-induced regulator in muscle protein 1 n=1 Tax=Perognathus longimembris pacificus TaxID=214514 RepID=UPI002018A6C9|nr:PGC-1 and ERR-induced regulator in muscle protein 1 [Perognathus longimembris pacificus]XP_048205972.1 PGC-1 and ERR-induced regulator in muscle protein 1 [Perognathus longimembris pacificus]XP_048205973.1 PGC-1 and ERR-induced regulator in muscle protein 1 [Perognathus longimembris pacificus]
MDNFQYSVQLSEQDWAEFSVTTDECGLLQAGLASGDELLSSDIDQGDSSGSSPPGPPPLLTGQLASRGRGSWGCKEEDVATQQLISRSQCEPVLALGASQQEASTSTQSEALRSLSLVAAPVSQCSFLPESAASRGEMQRLLQGPASSPAGDSSQSPEFPGCNVPSQKLPDSPGASQRSPGRKKRRGMGAKSGKRSGVPGPPAALLTPEAGPEEDLGAGTATLTAGALKDKPDPDSAGALEPGSGPSEEVARQGLDLGLPTPVPTTEQGPDQIRLAPRAELHTVPNPVQETDPDVSMAKPDVALSTPVFNPQPDMALSTLATKLQPDMTFSASTCKPQPDMVLCPSAHKLQSNVALCTPTYKPGMTLSTPATNAQPDNDLSTLAKNPQPTISLSTSASKPDITLSTPASTPQLDRIMSASASTHRLHVDFPTVGPGLKPEGDLTTSVSVAVLHDVLPHSASKTVHEVGVSTPAAPSSTPVSWVEPALADAEVSVLQGGYQEKPVREPLASAPGHPSGEAPHGPVQVTKKKKVRFSMALPNSEEPGLGEATGPPSSVTLRSPALQTRGGSSAWDAVAVGTRTPQPRILKHLPPPSPSASSMGPEPGSRFAVTLPEAYEFFFCDTIEEEDEDVEDEAVDSQALGEIQWPDTCEFFFQDFRVQRSRRQGHLAPKAPPRAECEATLPPRDLVPISIPEAYEHFFGEDGLDGTSATLLQLQTLEPLKEVELGLYPEPGPATAEQFSLAVRQADELRDPFTSFTFSQNDMCLVFVAFATWAVRTSDLHTPDAWKTVLLANIGTISAIRYFRQQMRRGRSPSRNSSPSSGPSPSPSC